MKPTRSQILAELNRELTTRRRVYPNWVRQDKLTQRTADHREACIARAIEILTPDPQASLFDAES